MRRTRSLHGPGRRRGVAVTLAVAAAAIPLACGDTEELSLCDAYEDLVAAGASVTALDPTGLSARQAAEVVDDYLATVLHVQETADGRYSTELDALETAVDDVARTLASVQEDEDYETWAPLVEDDLEVARDAAVVVREAIDPSCTTGS